MKSVKIKLDRLLVVLNTYPNSKSFDQDQLKLLDGNPWWFQTTYPNLKLFYQDKPKLSNGNLSGSEQHIQIHNQLKLSMETETEWTERWVDDKCKTEMPFSPYCRGIKMSVITHFRHLSTFITIYSIQ